MLTVYKASAGSGKTFQLVVEYLKLLLHDPQNYKRILAVTFTNKATNEMKTRILDTLYQLASEKKSDYIPHLQTNGNPEEKVIRAHAKVVLNNILHDYNRFSISTIDSFTQKVIKAFNRELGISPDYRLELNSKIILEEAIDRMLSKIGENKNLLNWLMEFSREKIVENYSQHIDSDLKNLGEELFKEKFQLFFPEDGKSVYSRENIDVFAKDLAKRKAIFESTLRNMAKKMVDVLSAKGFSMTDFSYGNNGIAGFIFSIANGAIKEAGVRVLNAENRIESWYSKHPEQAKIHSLVEKELQPQLRELLAFYRANEINYFSVLVVQKQLRMLGVLTDLREEVQLLLQEKGVLQMSDSNLLLNKIIGQSDSPFIYEKTGSFYRHFMLDEFQDTSSLQWRNFKPLITNSLAEGNQNLLVGDEKQSIYRWRNSDWQILAEQIQHDFTKEQLEIKSLGQNWRSNKNIIDFNNTVFSKLLNVFETQQFNSLDDESGFYFNRFANIYSNVTQKPGDEKKAETGFAKVVYFDDEDFETASATQLVEQVKQLQDSGIQASEIAILIRRNKEGIPIIKTFMAAAQLPENNVYNLSVLSNESLFLASSQAVSMVIHVIEHIVSPENKITKVALLNQFKNWLQPALAKRNIISPENTAEKNDTFHKNFEADFEAEVQQKIENLKQKISVASLDEVITQICAVFQLFEIETELPYLQTLIDKAGELKSSLSNDLSNWLHWWYETGSDTSVSVNEEVNAIRLLTVHKSKGLEYQAVLLPCFNWPTTEISRHAPILWCEPVIGPFNQFPLLPIRSGSVLKKTIFRNEYLEETANVFTDVFNLIYVAFTRAKSVLIVHCPTPKKLTKENADKPKSVDFLLNKALNQLSGENRFANCWNNEKTIFSYGEISVFKPVTLTSSSIKITKYKFHDFGNRIQLRKSGNESNEDGLGTISLKMKGNVIHGILAQIKNTADIENACNKALHDGKINEIQKKEIQKTLEMNFENPQITDWFSDNYIVLNERSLLTSTELHRPDRIIYKGDQAIVIDYKTGTHKLEKYKLQVTRYANILKETGFQNVKGFLWYIGLNEVEKVCEI